MSDQPASERNARDHTTPSVAPRPSSVLPTPPAAAAPAPMAAPPPDTAHVPTPEEQMARFAKELKENDWGHQPC